MTTFVLILVIAAGYALTIIVGLVTWSFEVMVAWPIFWTVVVICFFLLNLRYGWV